MIINNNNSNIQLCKKHLNKLITIHVYFIIMYLFIGIMYVFFFTFDEYNFLPDIKMHCSRRYSFKDLKTFAEVANLKNINLNM